VLTRRWCLQSLCILWGGMVQLENRIDNLDNLIVSMRVDNLEGCFAPTSLKIDRGSQPNSRQSEPKGEVPDL
jgi:hypothetical protein